MALAAVSLVKATGEPADLSLLNSHTPNLCVCLYFGAGWCPDCQVVNPMLKDFYAAANVSEKALEIVYVSSDGSEADMYSTMQEAHGDWLAIHFDNPQRQHLKLQHQVCARKEMEALGVTQRTSGIPTVVLLGADGNIRSFDALRDIQTYGLDCIQRWKEIQ